MKKALLFAAVGVSLTAASPRYYSLYGCYVSGSCPSSAPPAEKMAKVSRLYVQLDGEIRLSKIPKGTKFVEVDYQTPKKTIDSLKRAGYGVICYFSAGTYEKWRKDAKSLPKSAIGKKVDGWEGERWLDIRSDEVLALAKRRIDYAAKAGCNGVEPDNVDGYDNDAGFDLSYEDQLRFNEALADYAHFKGLLVGLKNDVGQVEDLIGKFDYATNEECHRYKECDAYDDFLSKGGYVLNIEYTKSSSKMKRWCAKTKGTGMETRFANLDLDGKRWKGCP